MEDRSNFRIVILRIAKFILIRLPSTASLFKTAASIKGVEMNIRWKAVLTGLFIFVCSFTTQASPWREFEPQEARKLGQAEYELTHQKARLLVLDELSMRDSFDDAFSDAEKLEAEQMRSATHQISKAKIELPLPDGRSLIVKLIPSRILPKKLSEKYPSIKTYKILPDKTVVNGRVDITPNGFHAMVQTRKGDTFLIDPDKANREEGSQLRYFSYRKQDQRQKSDLVYSCGAKPEEVVANRSEYQEKSVVKSPNDLLIYKIAISAAGEYTAKNGGTVESALAAIVTTLNRVNQVFEQDLNIQLSLADDNDQLIYIQAEDDPFDAQNLKDLLAQNQVNIDTVLGSQNYDIGHLFTTKGGGLAAIASVCNPLRKAKGVSGISNPSNDSFNLDFVAHEIGHQLGATHTFNSEEGLCSGDNRVAQTAFEPGSGSTIMSYAGYCGADNLQANTDAMFHIGSIRQINDETSNGEGSACGKRESTRNTPPSVDAGRNYNIPSQTPFELSGFAKDIDGDQLSFAWEQIDAGEGSGINDDRGDNALFRVHMPSDSMTQSFPPLHDILNHTKSEGETLPYRQRKLSFSFIAQDGINNTQSDDMMLNVVRTGSRFALNLPRLSYNRGETYPIFWNVANTDQSPISCESIDVFLSTDGGYTFDQNIAKKLPNTGKAWVTIPAASKLSTRGRFKIRCSDNIFFAISYRNFNVKDEADNLGSPLPDEDAPELNLADKTLSSDNKAEVKNSNSNATEAGGSLDYLLFLFLLWFLPRPNRIK